MHLHNFKNYSSVALFFLRFTTYLLSHSAHTMFAFRLVSSILIKMVATLFIWTVISVKVLFFLFFNNAQLVTAQSPFGGRTGLNWRCCCLNNFCFSRQSCGLRGLVQLSLGCGLVFGFVRFTAILGHDS